MQAPDLTVDTPRRWSDELGGIRWLPRLIDKARAAVAGTLGDYWYGQSPIDRSLLRALGISYSDLTRIVRKAGDDDEAVLAALQARNPQGIELARKWSERLPKRHPLFLFLIDLDDGYGGGPLRAVRGAVRALSGLLTRYVRYRWPAKGALIGLELEAERVSARAEAARGADEEPYRWLTAQSVDLAWKILLSVALIGMMLYFVVGFIERVGAVFLLIVAAIFFAYLIYPVIRWLNRKLPLILAILVVYAVLVGLVVVGLSYLIPALSVQVTTLVHAWPSIQSKLQSFVNDPNTPLLQHLPPFIRAELAQLPAQAIVWFQTHGGRAATNALSVLVGTAALLAAMVAVPVLAAYLLFDSEVIKRFFMGFIPERRRESTLDILAELEQVIGGFVRGQLLVGASVGVLIAIGLTIVHEPYAILIGVLAGALDLIPYIGPVIAAAPAVLIGFFTGGLSEAGWVLLVFLAANQAEGHVIAPQIVSRTIKLSPSAVVLAILIGGDLYGIPGMFIAVPIAGIIRVLALHVIPGSVSREEARPVLTRDSQEVVESDAEQAEAQA